MNSSTQSIPRNESSFSRVCDDCTSSMLLLQLQRILHKSRRDGATIGANHQLAAITAAFIVIVIVISSSSGGVAGSSSSTAFGAAIERLRVARRGSGSWAASQLSSSNNMAHQEETTNQQCKPSLQAKRKWASKERRRTGLVCFCFLATHSRNMFLMAGCALAAMNMGVVPYEVSLNKSACENETKNNCKSSSTKTPSEDCESNDA